MEKPKRIIFLDLLRVFAIIMMVQGHTVHTLLDSGYRTGDYQLYNFWAMFRGFTAPIFMFTAGAVFAYLFLSNGLKWAENPRVKKGIFRFLILIAVGYLLRYPTYKIFDFANVSEKQWLIFFGVDALHLIAFGLLFLVFTFLIAEKLKVKAHYLFLALSIVVFFIFPFTKMVNWAQVFPLPIAAYFTKDTGSLFPLFPWIGYVFSGGILGSYLVSHPKVYKERGFIILMLLVGTIFYAGGVFVDWAGYTFDVEATMFSSSWMVILQRLGVVLFISGIMVFIAKYIKDIPPIIKQIGQHSLVIYAVHLVILYGSAWVPGLYNFYRESLSVWATLGSVAVMYILMLLLVLTLEKIKYKRKQYLAAKA
ncbi:MAG: DUF1624 domain-containing protein [Bacteroidetes bacterium]|nr:DUF1624 domain-containing protein [Bacteroidota bacterium]